MSRRRMVGLGGMDVLNMFEEKIQRLNKKQHRKVYFGNDYHFHGMVV